jgi:uncharacterized protein (DUF1015 family)
MADLQPFRAYRPPRELAPRVACPPYDVLSTEEARELARGNEASFLHVSKPEIDFPAGHDPYGDDVYRRGRENFRRMIAAGQLQQDPSPAFYVYRQTMGAHVQSGLVAGASLAEYEDDRIRKHELTRPDKEDDRTRHIDALDANDEPVFLTYAAEPAIDAAVARIEARAPACDFTSSDGVGHTLWTAEDPAEVAALRRLFAEVPHLYVADGHHRSAAAARVHRARRESGAGPGASAGARSGAPAGAISRPEGGHGHFLAVIFPHDQMQILAYHRVVKDLGGADAESFLAKVGERFELQPAAQPEPDRPRSFGLFLGGRWLRLEPRAGTVPEGDPVRSLDAAILQENLLAPILGIEDPRRDRRIDFVGGIRGPAELERRVRGGEAAAAFALFPVGIEQLFRVADAGKVMPPKSTWFEPKLRSGLFVRTLSG